MGVVRAAEQVALGRTVAVKTLRPGRADATAVHDLLREAWITGSLEHPNVVPVHYLELDREGVPLVVLKRIEGVAWSTLIHDAAAVEQRFGATDLLAWNLGILVQLLNAVGFAHSRGILHRDLKPSNVMIGAFGEVYLLDWGIAVSLRDDGSGRLPLAARARRLAGTPGYMAPAMLGRDGDVLTERTDVYLAGAVLFEILAGHPPHIGRDALTIIAHILSVEPVLPASAPPELERLCSSCLSADPALRPASIDATRLAVQRYLEHRGSMQLGARASVDLFNLRRELQTAPREDLYRLFGACRFGFHEALVAWRDNEEARAGLREATVLVAEYELAHANPRGALALLGDIDAPAPLLARARELATAEADRQAALERLQRDLDPSLHQSTRLLVGAIIGVVFTILPLLNGWGLLGGHGQQQLAQAAFPAAVALLLGAVLWWQRASLGATAINRRTVSSAILVFVAQAALAVGVWQLGLGPVAMQVLMMLLWAVVTAQVALHVDRRFAVTALAYLLAFLCASAWPGARPYLASAGNLALLLTVLWLWRARAAE